MKKLIYSCIILFLMIFLLTCSSNTHVVVFDSNGGSSIESIQVEHGNLLSKPDVSKEGYSLEGWYTSLDNGETFDLKWSFTSDEVLTDLTLYAKYIVSGLDFDEETGTITDYTGPLTELVIPSEINGIPVTIIGYRAFERNDLTSVTIPNSVTTIKQDAFKGNDIMSVIIPESVTSISPRAFDWHDITSLTLSNNQNYVYENNLLLTSDDSTIIAGVGKLSEIVIPNSVTTIGDYAFYGNDLTSITISDSVTTIGSCAFFSNHLTTVTIPDSVTIMRSYAFNNNNLTSVIILGDESRFNGDWTKIGFEIELMPGFMNENGIIFDSEFNTIIDYKGVETVINIPLEINGVEVTTIGERAFAYKDLTSVTIPNSVTTIGNYAFQGNNITSVTIPNSVTILGEIAFDWYYIVNLDIGANENFIYENNLLFTSDRSTIIAGIGRLTEISIPDGVTTIRDRAFSSNNLTSVTIPDSVTTIGDSAFDWNSLTNVIIPDSVTTIGKYAFAWNSLTSVTISDSVKTIGDSAFEWNPLTSINILGDETRFNGEWENIGFPIDLKPVS